MILNLPASRSRELLAHPLKASLSHVEIEMMLTWIAAEVRAEQRFAWYRAQAPSRFIARCPPARN